jgi:hypothetical protein
VQRALLAAAIAGILSCRSTVSPNAPTDPVPAAGATASSVIGAPHNPPGTAHPPMRLRWEDTQHDELCKKDPKTGLPCPEEGGDKHCCNGRNECKGQSGCRKGAHACAGQNDCKGQGTSCPPIPVLP